ncbi:MAG TPA: glycosyltransferase family 2 protein [Candidatus Sumerlaeota bacterium]|nr:MAG: putative glycosyltransferase EpsH [candidate division BRC1 bacterium ADurb.Bin183]HOE62546.1 glycosyltransferase family 2 protein [Candidatus Sumerlaeota bacterium]HRR31824.1 glycosyltransferase family 2 protein [Candidatus Sumerlaeia bacterium]HON49306.1 glycosyltransferase family 2 protein [Candidatus Sumerlaeota bacterium]HOR64946.1 glycosyltransferase family 2 protein [Candidatus Sumerlaeota bacterium]
MNGKEKHQSVSIVILTWNSESFVDTCLESISWQTRGDYELVIVDNASRDKTLERVELSPFGRIVSKVIANKENIGCAGGNNVGWRAASGKIIIFLNPDTVVEPRWLEELAGALEHEPQAAVAGCKIFYPNTRTLQHAGGIIHPNGMTTHRGNGEEDRGQYDEICEMDYVTGAAIAVRRDFLESVGGFDEEYFPAYFEESDLCYRARKRGKKVLYVPKAALYHFESPGVVKFSPRFYELYYRMRMRFVLKNFSRWEILTKALPFELRWMLKEPQARGFRLMQLRALGQNLRWLFKPHRI